MIIAKLASNLTQNRVTNLLIQGLLYIVHFSGPELLYDSELDKQVRDCISEQEANGPDVIELST